MEIQDVVKKIFDIAGENSSDYREMYIDEDDNITITISFKKEETETIRLIAVDMDGNEYDLTTSKIEELKTEKKAKTYLEDLLEKYPNTNLGSRGYPLGVCPDDLGLDVDDTTRYKCDNGCMKCWTRPMKKEE